MSASRRARERTAHRGGGRDDGAGRRDAGTERASRVAYEVLEAVRESDAYANLLLPARIERALPRRRGCRARHRARLRHPAHAGLLRRGHRARGRRARRPHRPAGARRAAARRPPAARRRGCRPHAAVNESVALARAARARRDRLRQRRAAHDLAQRRPRTGARSSLAEAATDDDRLAAVYSHPGVDRAGAARPPSTAEGRGDELVALLAADNAAPRVNLVALPGPRCRASPSCPARRRSRFSPLAAVARRRRPRRRSLAVAGRPRPRAGRGLAARRARPDAGPARSRAGERWLDLCAGPGGKAALLAAEALAGGATLVANELVPARAELVRTRDRRRPLDVAGPRWRRSRARRSAHRRRRRLRPHPARRAVHRARRPAPPPGGALAQAARATSPSSRRCRASCSMPRSRALKPGGILAYVTCSPHTGRDARHAADARSSAAATRRRSSTPPRSCRGCRGIRSTSPAAPETVQLWPHRHGTDAMFIALLARDRVTRRRRASRRSDR